MNLNGLNGITSSLLPTASLALPLTAPFSRKPTVPATRSPATWLESETWLPARATSPCTWLPDCRSTL